MKKLPIVVLFFLILNSILNAQEYHPYKIKSGKIEYELRKYKTHVHHSVTNGKEKNWNEEVPFVAEIIIFYWDDYGDKSFEESWEVADFSGRMISETKKYEMLTVNGKKYYYNFKDNSSKTYPDNIRQECMDRLNFYQITGSWVKAAYGGTEKGTARVLNRETVHYQANDALDIFTWKGVPLREDTFNTTREGKRLRLETKRIATDMIIGLEFDALMFDAERMKPDSSFMNLTYYDIGEYFDALPNKLRQIDESAYEIRKGDVILYVSSDMHLGKLKVLQITPQQLIIKYVTFAGDGSVLSQSAKLSIPNNFTCELDRGIVNEDKMYRQDFRYKFQNKPWIKPSPTLGFYLLKESRTIKNK